MGYFLQKLAEESEGSSKRTAGSTAGGAAIGGALGLGAGAAGLGAAYGGVKAYDKIRGALYDREKENAIKDFKKKTEHLKKPLPQAERAKLFNKRKEIGLRAEKARDALHAITPERLAKVRGAAKKVLPAAVLAGLVGGGYALGKE